MDTHLHLLSRFHRRSDADAFCALVRDHAGMVFATAKRVTRDAALAEDVAQETFLELARRGHGVVGSVPAWLHRVAWRKACNAIRGESRRRRHEHAAADMVQAADEPTWEELEPLIDEALEELPADLREPLVLHYLEGHTQQELAIRMRVSQSTISRLLETGVHELRARLRNRGVSSRASLAALFVAHHSPSVPASLTASLGKLAISGAGPTTTAVVGSGAAISTALLTMSTTKVIFGVAAMAVLISFPLVISRQGCTPTAAPKAARIIPAKPAPPAWPKAQAEISRPKETNHYRPAPVSDEVRSKADAIIRRHAGMTREELMQSKELVALMDRMMAEMNDPRVMNRIQDSIAQLQAVTGVQGDGSMTLELFDTLFDARGRAWVEVAVSEDPMRMEEWLVNRFNGSIFEFALDPTLEKSSEGLSVAPMKPGVVPMKTGAALPDDEKND